MFDNVRRDLPGSFAIRPGPPLSGWRRDHTQIELVIIHRGDAIIKLYLCGSPVAEQLKVYVIFAEVA